MRHDRIKSLRDSLYADLEPFFKTNLLDFNVATYKLQFLSQSLHLGARSLKTYPKQVAKTRDHSIRGFDIG
jgi:hypothetical protein